MINVTSVLFVSRFIKLSRRGVACLPKQENIDIGATCIIVK